MMQTSNETMQPALATEPCEVDGGPPRVSPTGARPETAANYREPNWMVSLPWAGMTCSSCSSPWLPATLSSQLASSSGALALADAGRFLRTDRKRSLKRRAYSSCLAWCSETSGRAFGWETGISCLTQGISDTGRKGATAAACGPLTQTSRRRCAPGPLAGDAVLLDRAGAHCTLRGPRHTTPGSRHPAGACCRPAARAC